MTCKDCIHSNICKNEQYFDWSCDCHDFIDKSHFTKLQSDNIVEHGKWIPKDTRYREPYSRNYYCSLCGNDPIGISLFCPKCGAKMDGEAE